MRNTSTGILQNRRGTKSDDVPSKEQYRKLGDDELVVARQSLRRADDVQEARALPARRAAGRPSHTRSRAPLGWKDWIEHRDASNLTEADVNSLIENTGGGDFARGVSNEIAKKLNQAAFVMENILGTTVRTKNAQQPGGRVEFTGPLHNYNSYPSFQHDARKFSLMHSIAETSPLPTHRPENSSTKRTRRNALLFSNSCTRKENL